MIDWTRIDELAAEIGPDDLAEVLELFLDEADQEIARLRAGLPSPDIGPALHFLKGAALNLGFARLAALCEGAGSDDVAAVVACYEDTRQAFVQAIDTRAALRRITPETRQAARRP